jgi:hypothetical protein
VEPRLVIAYSLLLLLLMFAAGLVSYWVYHSPARSRTRQRRRDQAAHARRAQEGAAKSLE